MRKIPLAGVELTSQRVRGLRGISELPGVLDCVYVCIVIINEYIAAYIVSLLYTKYQGIMLNGE